MNLGCPLLSIPSPSGNIWIIRKWGWFAHKWFPLPQNFGGVLFGSLRLEMIYWWSRWEILPGYCRFLTWGWASDDDVNHVKSVVVVRLPQIWFLCLGKFTLSVWKEECASLLLSLTVFNHSPSCGKLTSGHNSQSFWSFLWVITSICLTWQ